MAKLRGNDRADIFKRAHAAFSVIVKLKVEEKFAHLQPTPFLLPALAVGMALDDAKAIRIYEPLKMQVLLGCF